MPKTIKPKLTGMARLINTKEIQLKTLLSQRERLTFAYQEEMSKLGAKIDDIEAIIKALKKG